MLLKKVSIFIDNYLRQRLTNKKNLECETGVKDSGLLAKAFNHAVVFPAELVGLLMSGYHDREELRPQLQIIYKFFDGCHAESDRIFREFRESVRIEATLKAFINCTVRVEIRFYRKSAKQEFYGTAVNFNANGDIC
ncbi:MAG: hypothetical protein AAB352_00165 [Patescibacteria group bacterium]